MTEPAAKRLKMHDMFTQYRSSAKTQAEKTAKDEQLEPGCILPHIEALRNFVQDQKEDWYHAIGNVCIHLVLLWDSMPMFS